MGEVRRQMTAQYLCEWFPALTHSPVSIKDRLLVPRYPHTPYQSSNQRAHTYPILQPTLPRTPSCEHCKSQQLACSSACTPTDSPPIDSPPTDSPPTDSPPIDSPPTDSPPIDSPPTDSPAIDSPPIDSPPPTRDSPPTDSPTYQPPPAPIRSPVLQPTFRAPSRRPPLLQPTFSTFPHIPTLSSTHFNDSLSSFPAPHFTLKPCH
ncbi:uncharacterized protein [Penaeus vannamei]|uniref:uncharacterized protein n=1 Tax=Penaeus vannamei TaxID=6689 RepID=UPI00387FA161